MPVYLNGNFFVNFVIIFDKISLICKLRFLLYFKELKIILRYKDMQNIIGFKGIRLIISRETNVI